MGKTLRDIMAAIPEERRNRIEARAKQIGNEWVTDGLLEAALGELADAEDNINLKADFIDATINDLAAQSQIIDELKTNTMSVQLPPAANISDEYLAGWVEGQTYLIMNHGSDESINRAIAMSTRINDLMDLVKIAAAYIGDRSAGSMDFWNAYDALKSQDD
jgi:hypothetical protein